MLTFFVLFTATALFKLWHWMVVPNWITGISIVIYGGLSMFSLISWYLPQQGRWHIDWDCDKIRIYNNDRVEFDGNIANLHQVIADGRGFDLYPTKNVFFRVRRDQTCHELEAFLNKTEEAQQAAPSNR
jgi:hypothetical protein